MTIKKPKKKRLVREDWDVWCWKTYGGTLLWWEINQRYDPFGPPRSPGKWVRVKFVEVDE